MDNFITREIDRDLAEGRVKKIMTRFPPEPNGYLHLGHAKAILLNFGIAEKYGGECNLRFDDTNPATESDEYVQAIKEDLDWLGVKPSKVTFASDLFPAIMNTLRNLVFTGKAYVCSLHPTVAEEYRDARRELTPSPFRGERIERNVDLFEKMLNGYYGPGSMCVRAKIDWSHPNYYMRDPVLARISSERHHRTGNKYKVYPTYDFAHPLCDFLEGITHSICTLEFREHRGLYDWVVESAVPNGDGFPKQREFAKLDIAGMVMSKRKLLELVKSDHIYGWKIDGWNDPRLPTLRGLRARGITPEIIREFMDTVGVSDAQTTIDPYVLDRITRDHYNKTSRRAMAVINPGHQIILGDTRKAELPNNPEDSEAGTRTLETERAVLIEFEDFEPEPPPKYNRLVPEGLVRLAGAGIIKCDEFMRDPPGMRLFCSWQEEQKVKGTIHWVPVVSSMDAVVCDIGPLFVDGQFNEESMVIRTGRIERGDYKKGDVIQLFRKGYYRVDGVMSSPFNTVFLVQVVSLKDSWVKEKKKAPA